MKGCVTFFFLFGFTLTFLDVMRIVGISLIGNIIILSLVNFSIHL
jgi:mannose/fructose/N-acetylgalactosamine-specific phosphotransferase system component IIC